MAAEPKEEAPEAAAAEGAKAEEPAAPAEVEPAAEEAKETVVAPAEELKSEEISKPKVSSREELEKKALQEFKLKVEEAIKANGFVLPPPPPAEPKAEKPKSEEAPKPEAESKAEEPKTEEAAKPEAESEPAKTEEPKVQEPTVEEPAVAETKEPVEAEDVFLWGIPLSPSAGDERTDVVLTKFLQARDFKVPAALAMLKSTVLWRKAYKTDGILEEAEEDCGFDSLAFMFGVDREGHPVCYNAFGALQDKELYARAVGEDSGKFLRWRVRLLEKGIRLLSFEPSSPNELIQVIDLKNSPWPAKKEVRSLLGQAIGLLQDNYPELVIKNVFINVPWYYSAIYSVISPFLTQRQKNKIVIARPGKSTEALFKFISPENVPLQYGGLGQPSDATYEGTEAPPVDLVVKAGEKKTVELAVTTSGAAVTWDLVVVGCGAGGSEMSYGAEFVPDREGGYTTIIEKTKKVEEPVRGTFTTGEPGKVVLTLDNATSRKKKLAVYRHVVKAAPEAEQQQQQAVAVELDA